MFNKVLLFILIALIAVQSIDAMADAVKFHQPNSPYSEADYFANETKNNAQQNNSSVPADSEQVGNDHCCYCHGVSHGALTDNSLAFHAINTIENIKLNQLAYLSQLISPDLRPPIF